MLKHIMIPLLLSATLVACAEDTLSFVCINEDASFDIEEVSSLEDTMGLSGGHDGVVINYDDSALPPGGSWRVGSVDVLLMIPASQFDYYPTNIRLGIEIFDGDSPATTRPWYVEQTVDTSALEWTTVNLSNPDRASERTQLQSWWRFDFSEAIPETGMQSTTFVVSAAWTESSLPTIGYSNYNRPCDKNWTKYDDLTGWVLNSERGNLFGATNPNSCNWPMLRVNVEERHEADSCAR